MVAQRCPAFSEDMRREGLLVMELQGWLMSLTESNYDTILDSILHSTFISTPARVEQLEQNLITAVTYRSPNLPIYARLTRDLVTCAGPDNSLGLFKGLILRTMHLFLDGEIIFPIECVDLPFIYQLTKAGVLTVPEAVATLAEYAKDTAMSCISLCWIFVWFAPEIEQLNPDLFLLLTAILTAESSTDPVYPAFRDFVLALPELSENEWKLLRERREGHNPRSLHHILRFDNLEELRNLAAHPNFDVDAPVRSSVFEPTAILLDDPPMLCYAAFYGAVKCCQFLILEGADLKKTDASGRTLAQFAVAGGHIKCVRMVDSYNCDFTDTIDCAAEYHHSEIFRWLHQNKAKLGPRSGLMIHTAAYANNVKHVLYCLSHGVDVNLRNGNEKTPLHIAAEGGFLDVLNILLSQPDIDVNARDLCFQTPLHSAAIFGRTFSVRLLLLHPKINVNHRDKWGKTPLHWAASRGHADVIEEFLRIDKIEANARDRWGKSPLQYVIGTRYTDALKVLQSDSRVIRPDENSEEEEDAPDWTEVFFCGEIPCKRVLLMADGHVKIDSFAMEKAVDFSKRLPVDDRIFQPLPPEVIGGKPHTAKGNIWGLGCFLYELCTFHRAFEASTLNGMIVKIVRESPSPMPPMYSNDMRDLIDSCLSKIPQKRPTIDQILNLPLLQPYLRESSGSPPSSV